jgi:CheY-like chemotaxis protein
MWQHGLVVTSVDRPKLALVVEDEQAGVDSMSRILEQMGVRAEAVPTGDAALASIASQVPDVIIVDVMMRSMSGFDLLRQLRGVRTAKGVPIIVLAAHGDLGEAAIRNGADAFVVKPGSLEECQTTIRRELAKASFVAEAIRESLSGLLSRNRAKARFEGIQNGTVQLRVPLTELRQLVKSRLDGLRGADEPGDTPDAPFEDDNNGFEESDNDSLSAIEVDAPGLDDLRERWLPALGVRVAGDDVELDVNVPAPRHAHAR